MAKIVNIPSYILTHPGWTDNVLATGIGDITVNADNISVVNITTSDIRNALSETSNSVYNLCTSSNINQWARYQPTRRGVLDSSMGAFAGYNHFATAPNWPTGNKATAEANVWIDSGGYPTFSAIIDIGERLYSTDTKAFVLTIWDGAILKGVGFTTLADVELGVSTFIELTATGIDALTADKTYTCKIFVGDSEDTFASDLSNNISAETTVLNDCGIDTFTGNVKVKQATFAQYSDACTPTWTLDPVSAPNLVIGGSNNGRVSFNGATNISDFTSLVITATCYNWLNEVVGTQIEMYNGAYTTPNDLGYLEAIPYASITSTGYRVEILIDGIV